MSARRVRRFRGSRGNSARRDEMLRGAVDPARQPRPRPGDRGSALPQPLNLVPTVLVVEDDPQVLDVVTRIVRKGGYHAIPARDGREAWGIFQRAEPPIDLVITDVVMPYMTGTELAAHVLTSQPDLPVILMSAFTPEDLARRGLALSHGHLLTKPFTPSELLNLVRRLIPG
jgi:CheY-like chemotaxis protein